MRRNRDYMGAVELFPLDDVTAGEFSTWVITFTAGEYGIDDGGSLVIAWKSVSDWDTPQFDEPAMPGYTTVKTDGKCCIRARYAKFVRPFGNSILIDVTGGYIKKGDTITITLGDTSGGSLGMRAQSFCEREHEFRAYLDACGTARYEEMPDRMKVKIVAGYHHEIQAVVPGTVEAGEPFDILLRALDEFGNPTERYQGEIDLCLTHGVERSEGIPEHFRFPADTDGAVRIQGCRIFHEGFWSLKIEDRKNGYLAYSNGSKCVKPGGTKKLFWGDMHGQTRETVGTGLLEDYYSFARDKAGVDFTGWQGNDFEVSDETWEDVRSYTKKFNEEGKYLVFLGYEWSGTTPQGGDHNVYFLNDNEVFYASSNWTETQVDVNKNANPVTELHEKLGNREDVLLIPHIGGRYANLDYLNRQYTSVIEIHSHHGTFEWFAFDAMKRHLKVGFIAASDDHTCRPGLSYPLSGHGRSASGAFDVASGFTGVFAEALTKEAVWKAIKSRHCYASTFDRIYLNTSLSGIEMGDEGVLQAAPVFHLEACGNYPIESFEIYDWDKRVHSEACLRRAKDKIRIRWSGVVYRGRGKSANWNGMIYVKNGKIKSAKEYAFDRMDQGILIKTDQYVEFTSSTSGDYDGMILELEAGSDTVIKFSSNIGNAQAAYSDIMKEGFTKNMGGLNLTLEMEAAFEETEQADYEKQMSIIKDVALPDETGEHAYWVKVLQSNGNAAWSSPVFVKRKKE